MRREHCLCLYTASVWLFDRLRFFDTCFSYKTTVKTPETVKIIYMSHVNSKPAVILSVVYISSLKGQRVHRSTGPLTEARMQRKRQTSTLCFSKISVIKGFRAFEIYILVHGEDQTNLTNDTISSSISASISLEKLLTVIMYLMSCSSLELC